MAFFFIKYVRPLGEKMDIKPSFRTLFYGSFLFFVSQEISATSSQPYPLFKMPVVSVRAHKNPFYLKKSNDVRVLKKENGFSNEHRFETIFENISALNSLETGSLGGASFVAFPGGRPSGTLVLWEDLTLNDPASLSGTFDFSTLGMDAFEGIEMFQGNDPTVGTAGTGGTIKLFTSSLDKKTPYDSMVRVEGGSNGFAFLEGRQRTSFKKGALKIGGMGLRTDGASIGKSPLLRKRIGYESISFDAQGKFQLKEKTSASFFLKETEDRLQDLYDIKGHVSTWSHLGALSMYTENEAKDTMHRFGISESLLIRRSFAFPMIKTRGEREEIRYALTHFINSKCMLMGGGGLFQEGFNENGFKKSRLSKYGFLSQTSEIFPKLDFTTGARVEENNRKSSPLFAFKTGISYTSEKLINSLTFDLAQKNPSLYELFASNVYAQGDPTLKPEKAYGLQAVTLRKEAFSQTDLGLRFFERWFSKSIIGTMKNGKTFYASAPLYRAQGIEPFWASKIGKKLTFQGEFTYTDLKRKKNAISPVILTPPFKATGSLIYMLQESTATQESVSFSLKGRYLHYKNTQIKKPTSFTIFDAGVDWYVDAQKKIYIEFKNILNTQYRTQIDPNIRGEPFSFRVGVQFKF
ncbi:MAG: TonB-dependent receptor [Proteobacteria bacterium]|nr:TonB-dependent receptor [Pseudomonadota bacterium]